MSKAKLSVKERKEKIEEGWIHTNVIFEMIGSPKEHIEKALQLFLDNIASDDHVIVLSEDREETIETEGGMFSTAAELEYLIYGLDKLTWFAFNFMPASIEIKAPKELTFKDKDMSAWMNDLLAKLHEVNVVHTSLQAQYDGMVKNLNNAIRNNILLGLTEAMTAKQLSAKIGMSEKSVLLFCEKLLKEGKLEHKNKKFSKKV